jgi:hypothetical protein
MKKKYMKPEMLCITLAAKKKILAGSPTDVHNSYSDREALSRSNDLDDEW